MLTEHIRKDLLRRRDEGEECPEDNAAGTHIAESDPRGEHLPISTDGLRRAERLAVFYRERFRQANLNPSQNQDRGDAQ